MTDDTALPFAPRVALAIRSGDIILHNGAVYLVRETNIFTRAQRGNIKLTLEGGQIVVLRDTDLVERQLPPDFDRLRRIRQIRNHTIQDD